MTDTTQADDYGFSEAEKLIEKHSGKWKHLSEVAIDAVEDALKQRDEARLRAEKAEEENATLRETTINGVLSDKLRDASEEICAFRAERDAAIAERDEQRRLREMWQGKEDAAGTLAERLQDERDNLAKHLGIDLSQDETSRSDDQIFAAHYDRLTALLARVEEAVGPFIKKMANASLADMDALYQLMQEARALASLSSDIKKVLNNG